MAVTVSPQTALQTFTGAIVRLRKEYPSDEKKSLRHKQYAKCLKQLLEVPNLLTPEQLVPVESDGQTPSYKTCLLWSDREHDMSLMAMVWKKGQFTCIHDHKAACMVGVYQGAEMETRYQLLSHANPLESQEDDILVEPVGQSILGHGMVTVLSDGPCDIHRVEAIADDPTITVSFHLYEIDITRTRNQSSIDKVFKLSSDAR